MKRSLQSLLWLEYSTTDRDLGDLDPRAMSLTVVPASNGKFSFAVDSFYVESSGNHLHRRATVPELQARFQPYPAGSKSHDNVGHW